MSIKAIVAIASAIIALLVLIHLKKTRATQVYLGFLSEYKSKETLAAIEGLYKFKDECVNIDCWRNEYDKRKRKTLEKFFKVDDEKALCTLENSLHHQRRMVSHFYHAIYVAAKHRTIPRRRIFGFWPRSEKDEGILAILKKIGIEGGKGLDELNKMLQKHKKRNEKWGWFLRPWYWLFDWFV